MRKAIIAVLSVILVFAAAIPAFSVKAPDIDGDMSDNNEWGKAVITIDKTNKTESDESDSKYKCLWVYQIVEESEKSIYYGIKAQSTKKISGSKDLIGVYVTINQAINNQFLPYGGSEASNNNCHIDYSIGINEWDNGYEIYFEMKAEFKKAGWNKNSVTAYFQIDDDLGKTSDEIEITHFFDTDTSPEDYGTTGSSGSKTTKASKTTTEKSTKTTTQKLTGGSRVPTTRRGVTTSAATTTKKPTEPQTTAAKTTSAKVRTTKAKTTRTRTTKAQSSRETASYAAGTGETTVVYMLDAEALSALINTTSAQTQADRSAFGIKTIPRSTLLKGVTAAAALILFGIIGAWAVKSRSDDDEPPKDEKEDSGDKADNNEKED